MRFATRPAAMLIMALPILLSPKSARAEVITLVCSGGWPPSLTVEVNYDNSTVTVFNQGSTPGARSARIGDKMIDWQYPDPTSASITAYFTLDRMSGNLHKVQPGNYGNSDWQCRRGTRQF